MTEGLRLRDTTFEDLPLLHAMHRDPVANRIAAFTVSDPEDAGAFQLRWRRFLADEGMVVETVESDGAVIGSVLAYREAERTEVSYWYAREYWGRGIAGRALADFLTRHPIRPLHARTAKDNIGSLRVLQKCGFVLCGEGSGYAATRGHVVEEYELRLD